jgi:hypothetical protein
VSGVSVSPSSPAVNQSTAVTVTGQDPCDSVLIEFGDGDAQFYTAPGLPFTRHHTWTNAGSKTITATGYGNCSGKASLTVRVTEASAILQLCANLACGKRQKMYFKPTITALFGFNTPGGYLAIAGNGFGPSLGRVMASLRTWSGASIQRRLEAVEWTNTLVGVQWPADISGVRHQAATLVITTVDGVESAARSFTFSPALDLKRLSMADVKTISCGSDSNHDVCNKVSYEILPSFVYIPPELSANAAIVGAHMNRWGAIGNDKGTDIYEIALKRDWTLSSFDWRVSAEPGQAAVRKPSGFTLGPTWSPSIDWEVTPNDQVVYAGVLTITGPIGVPYK